MARFIIKDHDIEGRDKECCDCSWCEGNWAWCEIEDRPCECRCHDEMADGDYHAWTDAWHDIGPV